MTLEQPPYVLQSASHPAFLFRQAVQSLLSGSGVIGPTDLAVSAGGGMSVNVAPGQSWTPGTLGATAGIPAAFTSQGCYYGYNDGVVNLTVAASNSTNARIDLVCLTVADAYYSGAANQSVIQIVTGTPAATPAVPATPASSLALAQVTVPAAATSIVTGNIADQRPFLILSVPLRENPAGRTYLNSTTFSVSGSVQAVGTGQVSYLYGGMTTVGGALVVPTGGAYWAGGQLQQSATSSPEWIQSYILHNGNLVSWGNRSANNNNGYDVAATCGPDLIACAPGDTLELGYKVSVAGGADVASGQNCYFAAALAAQ